MENRLVIIAVACVTMIIIALDAPSLPSGRYKDLAVFVFDSSGTNCKLAVDFGYSFANPNLGIERWLLSAEHHQDFMGAK